MFGDPAENVRPSRAVSAAPSGRLTQQREGPVLAVSSQQVAAVSRKLVQNPIKGVNVVSSEQAASAGRSSHQSCEISNQNQLIQINVTRPKVRITCQVQEKQNFPQTLLHTLLKHNMNTSDIIPISPVDVTSTTLTVCTLKPVLPPWLSLIQNHNPVSVS